MKENSGKNPRNNRKQGMSDRDQSEEPGSAGIQVQNEQKHTKSSGNYGDENKNGAASDLSDAVLFNTILQDLNPCGYFIVNRDCMICSLNPSGAVMLGSGPLNLINSSFRQFVSDDTLDCFSEFITSVFATGARQTCIVELKQNDNSINFTHLTGVRTGDGLKCLISAADITESKIQEEELRISNRFLLFAGETARFGVWSIETANYNVSLSEEIFGIFELPEDFHPSIDRIYTYFAPGSNEMLADLLKECMEKGTQYDEILEAFTYTGKKIWVRTTGEAMRDANGRITKVYGSLQDITRLHKESEGELEEINKRLKREIEEHKKTEQGLTSARIEAEKANKAKTEFIASMSHEIRTPLNAILGYSELLGSSMNEPFEKEYLEAIKIGGRTLLTLFNDILDLAKIEAGKVQLEMDFIDIVPFFTEFEKIFAYRLSEKGIKYSCDLGNELPAYLYIDGARLRQVVLNIVGNAIKFTNEGEVKLKVYSRNHDVVIVSEEKQENVLDLIIEVKDTGIGIQPEHQREIFGAFFQVQSKTAQSGAGLGLPIALRLTRLMHGKIALKSVPGEGSTFTIKIPHVPYQKFHQNLKDDLKISPPDLKFEKATIMVVDDVEGNCRHIRDLLEGTGLTVFEAENGLEALELIKIAIPDLVITDIIMPGLDGFGLVEKIKSDKKLRHIPVIAYTASVLKEQRDKIVRSEFSDLLIKPVHAAELFYVLMNFLRYTPNPVGHHY